jgi:hypothetical protein
MGTESVEPEEQHRGHTAVDRGVVKDFEESEKFGSARWPGRAATASAGALLFLVLLAFLGSHSASAEGLPLAPIVNTVTTELTDPVTPVVDPATPVVDPATPVVDAVIPAGPSVATFTVADVAVPVVTPVVVDVAVPVVTPVDVAVPVVTPADVAVPVVARVVAAVVVPVVTEMVTPVVSATPNAAPLPPAVEPVVTTVSSALPTTLPTALPAVPPLVSSLAVAPVGSTTVVVVESAIDPTADVPGSVENISAPQRNPGSFDRAAQVVDVPAPVTAAVFSSAAAIHPDRPLALRLAATVARATPASRLDPAAPLNTFPIGTMPSTNVAPTGAGMSGTGGSPGAGSGGTGVSGMSAAVLVSKLPTPSAAEIAGPWNVGTTSLGWSSALVLGRLERPG